MKKILKVFYTFSLILSIFICTNQFIAKADTITDSSLISNIAINSATENMGWKDVYISNIKNVYDFNDKLVAYSVDLKDKTTGLKGYEIISANEEDGPILEFSKGRYSPYDRVSNKDKCIYNGFLSYYSKNAVSSKGKTITEYYDIKNNSKLNQDKINYSVKTAKNKEYKSSDPNKSLKTRTLFSSKVQSNSLYNTNIQPQEVLQNVATQKLLEDVPDDYWYKGCTPTAIAMALEYDYYNYTPEFEPLVNVLAPAIGTESNGDTALGNNVINGISQTMKNYGVNVSSSFDGWGRNNSTYDEFVNEINNNHPVVANVIGSTYTSWGYPAPQGFGNHSCAGMGYEYTSNEKFIVVHDDAMDGDVYCDFNSSALGDNIWLYIH
ncbi:MAG: hypothetical protein K0R54_4296 [Clostridiaceae bacterium]|jgi:hypothetical protein|nr:hypothetical protein [Clostridiaceae bacterium]